MKYQLHQNIYFARDKMQDSLHFNWLFRAICLVDAKYIRYKIGNPDNEEEYMLHKERVFAYELYRQWANIIESECKKPLVLNAELDKIIAEDIDAIGERVDDGNSDMCRLEEFVLPESKDTPEDAVHSTLIGIFLRFGENGYSQGQFTSMGYVEKNVSVRDNTNLDNKQDKKDKKNSKRKN